MKTETARPQGHMTEHSMARRAFLELAAGAGLALAGTPAVARSQTRPASQPAPASCPSVEAQPGTLVGMARFKGKAPEPEIVDCSADPQCAQLYRKEPLLSEDLVVGREGGLQNVFVSVRRGLDERREWPVPAGPVILDQQGCRYLPHVFGVMAGQPLEIRNSSRINEVPHGYPKRNPEFSFTLPRRGMSETVVLREPETFRIECDVHPWELSWCHVMSHPFYAVTDARGRFMLSGLDPGEYELELWHEHGLLGVQTRLIRIVADAPTRMEDVVFEFKRPRRPLPRERG